MRIPDLGAIQRVGDLASTRAKLDVSEESGKGHYYILEFDHESIARAIFVNEDGEPQASKLLQVEESKENPAETILIEGRKASLDMAYQPELLPQFRKRLKDEKTAREKKATGTK